MSGSKSHDGQMILEFNPDLIITGNTSKLLSKTLFHKGISTQQYNIEGPSGKCPKSTLEDIQAWSIMMSGQLRLYVRGHGNWKSQTIGDWTATDVGDLIGGCKFDGSIKTVSVTGCALGRDLDTATEKRVADSANSFGSQLHAYLKQKYQISTVLYARVYNVSFDAAGRKFTSDTDGAKHKRAYSKIRFSWDNGAQRREWAYEKEVIGTGLDPWLDEPW